MSSKTAPAGRATEDKTTALETLLYDECFQSFEDNPTFFQDDLFELDILPSDDVAILLAVTQALTDEKLFKVVQDPLRGIGWKLRTQDEAKQYDYHYFPSLTLRTMQQKCYLMIYLPC